MHLRPLEYCDKEARRAGRVRSGVLIGSALWLFGFASPGCGGASASAPAAEVTIDLTARTASGALGTARDAADRSEFIGCRIEAYTQEARGVCYAGRTLAGAAVSVECSTDNLVPGNYASMLVAMRALSGDSMLTFGWDEKNLCTFVGVENGSSFDPKGP